MFNEWYAKDISKKRRIVNRGGKKTAFSPTDWRHSTVAKILFLQEYCGDVINFKTYSKSYKMKRRIENTEENRVVFPGVHEAIIDRETWEKVQKKRGTRKKPAKAGGERSIFSGLLKCPDCGGNLNYHFNQGNHDIKYFNCCNYNRGRDKCTATHYIRLDFLEQVVLQEIHRLTQFANEYEDDFVKAIIGHSMKTANLEQALKQKISDERFSRMSQKYEQEQGEVAAKIKALRKGLRQEVGQRMTADMFLEIVRRYTDAQELTQRMVTELIDHIDVYHAERVNGEITQEIKIFYNCIGAFEVPEWKNIPELEVLIETRKGVALSYSQAKAG